MINRLSFRLHDPKQIRFGATMTQRPVDLIPRAFFLCAGHDAEPGGENPLQADWPELLAEGNCVAARRGGQEAGSKTRS